MKKIRTFSLCYPWDTPGFPKKITANSVQPFGRLCTACFCIYINKLRALILAFTYFLLQSFILPNNADFCDFFVGGFSNFIYSLHRSRLVCRVALIIKTGSTFKCRNALAFDFIHHKPRAALVFTK